MMLLSGLLLLLLFEVQFFKSSAIYKQKIIRISKVEPAPICKHGTYCEITPHYPTDMVLKALEMNPHLQEYANRDEIDINMRMDGEPEEEPLCVSMEQLVFPKLGVTRSSEWKYIVNHDNFTQSVLIETCLEEDKPCKVIEGFAEGYYTKCKQRYIYRQLFAVTPDGLIQRDSFRFPASCCCHIEFLAKKFLRSFESRD